MTLDAGGFFAPGGRLESCHASYESRSGQLRMAQAVAAVLEGGGRLMVEAPTGTGKTLAYLVPALAAGRRVIVSTGTRNLQDQIFEQDIPFLRDTVGFDVRATVMKGRDNYLCRYRMAQFEREPLLENLDERPWLDRLAAWSHVTDSGDRAEIADLPDRLRLWRDVNARADTCGGSRCPEFDACWLTQMKRRARDSQIIVVNHHLFFADLAVRTAFGEVLPDYDTVVFDEAHMLEEVATLFFGAQLSSGQFEELARQSERLAARGGGPSKGGGGAAGLRLSADAFFEPLRARYRRSAGRSGFEPVERGGIVLDDEWDALDRSLDDVARQAERTDHDEASAERVSGRVQELREAAGRILARDDPAFVYGAEVRGRSTVALTASPIDVSELLQANLFERLHAAVLTSATLTVRKKFEFFRERLGLDRADELRVESGFDYERQAALYLPAEMPEPSHQDFVPRVIEEVERLLELSNGRAFVLFTSYANMERVERALRERAKWPLLVQGEGTKVALVETFRSTPGAVLLGTTSFWHGVDVPGDALSLVVIDKLPFDVPNDPLVAARIERIRAEGGNPFMSYQLPLAVLELKQGLGRLLRSRRDRGVLAVLDPRVRTKRYGKVFLDSLPPYRVVNDIEECQQYL